MTMFLVLSTFASAVISAYSFNTGDWAWGVVSGLTAIATAVASYWSLGDAR